MKYRISVPIIFTALLMPFSFLNAHHNTHSEFGWFDTTSVTFEGEIVKIAWGNPHVALDIESTGGDIAAGEKWRVVSHPVNIMTNYDIKGSDFVVGGNVKVIGWKHRRKLPALWLRAVQKGEQLISVMRFTDMQDIANGVLEQKNIVPAADLNGSNPKRAGDDAIEKLRAMGLLDDDGMLIWPPPQK